MSFTKHTNSKTALMTSQVLIIYFFKKSSLNQSNYPKPSLLLRTKHHKYKFDE